VENIVTAPKTDMFRFRINPEIRKQVEEVYAKNGLTFTEIKTNSLHRRRFKICLAITKEDALAAQNLRRNKPAKKSSPN